MNHILQVCVYRYICMFGQFEQAIGGLPDAKLPVANQLEEAIFTIRNNVKVILDTQAENKALKQVRMIFAI